MPQFSQPLLDASLAMAIIRKNAEEWNIDPEKIACIGFSAGGHVVTSTAIYGENKPNEIGVPYSFELSKADKKELENLSNNFVGFINEKFKIKETQKER